MPLIAFDFYEENAPNAGSPIGSLTEEDLVSAAFEVQHKGMGWGRGSISRHHPSADLVREDRYVKIRVPLVDAAPIHAFWSREQTHHLSSRRGKGGELLTFGGPGPLFILRLARLLHSVWAPDQPWRGSQHDLPGRWWWQGENNGSIMVRGIEEGQYQTIGSSLIAPLDGLTIDFDRVEDSSGTPWTAELDEFETAVGTSILDLYAALSRNGEFFLEGLPNLLVRAWQTYPGRDLTGSVHFRKGVNIASELGRAVQGKDAWNAMVQEDAAGAFSTELLAGAAAGSRLHIGFGIVDSTTDDSELNRIAQETLRASRSELQRLALDVRPGAYLPGREGTANGDYWTGDTVLLSSFPADESPGAQDYEEEPQLVTSIRVSLGPVAKDGEARSLRQLVTFNQEHRIADQAPPPHGSGAPGSRPVLFCPPTLPPGAETPGATSLALAWTFGSGTLDDGTSTYDLMDTTAVDPGSLSGTWGKNNANGKHMTPRAPCAAGQSIRITGDYAKQLASTLKTSYVRLYWWTTIGQVTNTLGYTQIGIGPSGSGRGVVASIDETVVVPVGATYFDVYSHDNLYGDDIDVVVSDAPTPGAAGFLGAGHVDLLGTSRYAKRCDAVDHVWRETVPGVNDDAIHGYPAKTGWLVVDDQVNPTVVFAEYYSLEDATGAAVWVTRPPAPHLLGAHDDVDLETTPPADGDVLVWDDAAQRWVPAAGGGGSYSDEQAQDAVGGMVADTATVNLTYTDATPELKADVIPGGIEITDLAAAETDDTLVLAPDGTGGVEWVAPSGGLTPHDHTGDGDGGDLDAPVIDGYAVFNEESAPSSAASGTVRVYAKADGRIYSKGDDGVEYGPFDAAAPVGGDVDGGFVIEASAQSQETANTTSHTVALPSGIVAGERLLIFFGRDGGGTVTPPSGWASVVAVNSPGPDAGLAVLERIADGSEGGSVTVTTSASEKSESWAIRLSGAHASTAAEGTAQGNAQTTAPPIPSHSLAGWSGDALWFIVLVSDLSSNAGVLANATPYPFAPRHQQSGAATDSCTLFVASWFGTAAVPHAPPSARMNTNEQTATALLAIRPA